MLISLHNSLVRHDPLSILFRQALLPSITSRLISVVWTSSSVSDTGWCPKWSDAPAWFPTSPYMSYTVDGRRSARCTFHLLLNPLLLLCPSLPLSLPFPPLRHSSPQKGCLWMFCTLRCLQRTLGTSRMLTTAPRLTLSSLELRLIVNIPCSIPNTSLLSLEVQYQVRLPWCSLFRVCFLKNGLSASVDW